MGKSIWNSSCRTPYRISTGIATTLRHRGLTITHTRKCTSRPKCSNASSLGSHKTRSRVECKPLECRGVCGMAMSAVAMSAGVTGCVLAAGVGLPASASALLLILWLMAARRRNVIAFISYVFQLDCIFWLRLILHTLSAKSLLFGRISCWRCLVQMAATQNRGRIVEGPWKVGHREQQKAVNLIVQCSNTSQCTVKLWLLRLIAPGCSQVVLGRMKVALVENGQRGFVCAA
jgi:hypothetical protein